MLFRSAVAVAEAAPAPQEEAAVIRFMLGVDDALRAIPPAAPGRGAAGPAVPVQGLLDAISEVFRTWLVGRIGNPSYPAGDQKPDTVCGDDAVPELARVRAEQGAPPNSGEFGYGEFEDELSLPDAEALDMLPAATAGEKHTRAVDFLMAALVHAGMWQVGGTVRHSGRPAPKKFARQRLISFPQVSC